MTWIKKKTGPGIYNITTTEEAEKIIFMIIGDIHGFLLIFMVIVGFVVNIHSFLLIFSTVVNIQHSCWYSV